MGKSGIDPETGHSKRKIEEMGVWNQFDPFGAGDAKMFETAGKWNPKTKDYDGSWGQGEEENIYTHLTPEQKQTFLDLRDSDNHSLGPMNDFVAGLRKQYQSGGQGEATSAAPASGFMQAATPSVSTPFGDQQWTQDANGQWHQQTSLAGPLGAANSSLQSQYANLLGAPMDTGASARDQAINAAYGQSTSRLDPQWDRRQEGLRTQLLNQGLDPTSEAGKNAMGDFGRERNDAYGSAMNSAILQGNQAGNDVFRNNLASRLGYLQQMQGLQGLSQSQPNQGLLNAYIAQQNNKLGQASMLQANNADLAGAGMAAAGAAAKAVPGIFAGTQSTPGGAIGYDNSGTPYYSNPTEWENPYGYGG